MGIGCTLGLMARHDCFAGSFANDPKNLENFVAKAKNNFAIQRMSSMEKWLSKATDSKFPWVTHVVLYEAIVEVYGKKATPPPLSKAFARLVRVLLLTKITPDTPQKWKLEAAYIEAMVNSELNNQSIIDDILVFLGWGDGALPGNEPPNNPPGSGDVNCGALMRDFQRAVRDDFQAYQDLLDCEALNRTPPSPGPAAPDFPDSPFPGPESGPWLPEPAPGNFTNSNPCDSLDLKRFQLQRDVHGLRADLARLCGISV